MIKKVTDDNAKEWAELCMELWPDEPHHSVDYFLRLRKDGLFEDEFLYYDNGIPIAFLSLSIRNDYVEGTRASPVAYIEGIYIRKEHQGKGISRKFVAFAKEWGLKKNCNELASDCLIENENSRQWHNHVGFKEANVNVHFVMNLKDD